MCELLAERGHAFTTSAEREICRDMKEKLTYVSLEPEAECARKDSVERRLYELPSGSEIQLDLECMRCPEALFKPSLIKARAARPAPLLPLRTCTLIY